MNVSKVNQCLSQFGGYNKIYHKLGGLNNRYFFPTILGARESRIKVPVHSVSGEGPLPNLRMATLLYAFGKVSGEVERAGHSGLFL